MDAPPRRHASPAQWENWNAYNHAQLGRPVRQLCREVMAVAGPGAGRVAWDIGAGAGIEARALQQAGWRVCAVELEAESATLIAAGAPDVEVQVGHVATLLRGDANGTPPTLNSGYDLLHASVSLPYVGPIDFPDVWAALRERARPGAWLAVDLLGDRDGFADHADVACMTRSEAKQLFHGLRVVQFDEVEEEGESCLGPKHWHLFTVIAQNETR